MVDAPEFKLNKHESIQMPFRYVKNEDGNPILPEVSLLVIMHVLPTDNSRACLSYSTKIRRRTSAICFDVLKNGVESHSSVGDNPCRCHSPCAPT